MNLIRMNSFYPIYGLKEVIQCRCSSDKSEFAKANYMNGFLRANVIENDKEFAIELAAPGLSKNDFNIELNTDKLIISVNKEVDSRSRYFRVTEEIDKKKILAQYDKGILHIKLPKLIRKNESKIRVIEVS